VDKKNPVFYPGRTSYTQFTPGRAFSVKHNKTHKSRLKCEI